MSDLALRLRAALEQELPAELAEVALLAVAIESVGDDVRLVVRQPAWQDLITGQVEPAARRLLHRLQPDALLVVSEVDGPTQGETWAFTAFLEDPGNALAVAACRRVVDSPGLEHNPLLLHGPGGCGKSHLARAVAQEYRTMLGASAAILLTGEELVRRAHDLAQRRSEGLRAEIDAAAVLLIDGLDAIAGKDLAQEELFSLINAGLERGQQLLFTTRGIPRAGHGYTDRLASRLGWGLVVELDLPLTETRLALLRRLLGDRADGFPATDLSTAVERQAPDFHQVHRLAERLRDQGALALGREPQAVSFDRIVQVTAERFGLRPGDLIGKRRHAEVVHARGIALCLGRRLTGHSLQALGGMVGGRDHTTVMNALRTTEERLDADPQLRQTLQELTQAVLSDRAQE